MRVNPLPPDETVVADQPEPGRRVWLIRGHDMDGEDRVPWWIEQRICETSWKEVGKIPRGMPYAEILRCTQRTLGNDAGRAKQIDVFVNGMNVGDLIAVTAAKYPDVKIGRIASKAKYSKPKPGRHPRTRRVEWLAFGPDVVSRSQLASETVKQLNKPYATVYEITDAAAVELANAVGLASVSVSPDWRIEYLRLTTLAESRESVNQGRRTVSVTSQLVRMGPARQAVLVRSQGQCERPGCGVRLDDVTDEGEWILEIDHIQGLAEGGADNAAQMIALCPNCHALKTHGRRRHEMSQVLLKAAAEAHADAMTSRGLGQAPDPTSRKPSLPRGRRPGTR